MGYSKRSIFHVGMIIFFLFLLIPILFCHDTASAQSNYTATVSHHEMIQVWQNGAPKLSQGSPYWVELLGGVHFQTDWIKVKWSGVDVDFQIQTNMPERGVDDGGNTGSTIGYTNGGGFWQPPDLFIDLNQDGVYDVAIVLIDHGPIPADPSSFPDPPGYGKSADNFVKGGVYKITDWFNSDDIHRWHYEYGGRYHEADPKVPPIWARHGQLIGHADIFWGNNPTTSPASAQVSPDEYLVDIHLNGINTKGDWNRFCLFWGSGNCANNIVSGCVSGPPDTKTVPTMNEWGMILFALLTLMLGARMVARRHSV